MSRKKWVVKPYDRDRTTEIAEALDVNPYAALIATSRGIDSIEKARRFFGMEKSVSADPMDFPDMYVAVKRIQKALEEFERIAVYGDYDADGVTATTLLYSYLEMQGADVVYCLPNRHTDGYGLNFCAIDRMSQMGAKLIITVDNGITAVEEAEYIRKLDMELIVTDHHLPSETIPEAVAVVDPHRKDCILDFKDYAGVGVAYKLICAMEGEENEITESFLDLVTIGTLADVMPLIDENRDIVRRGIPLINESDRLGIQALIEIAGLAEKTLTSMSITFGLVPRINAAGRMDTAEKAVKLLLCDDYDDAQSYAEEINEDNILRQKTESEISAQAIAQIEANPDWLYDNVLVVEGENWNDGVIGIVASRIADRYGKPAIVITVIGGEGKGSGRSIEGFNLYEALKNCKDILNNYGGHTLAAGVGIDPDRIDEFREKINAYADSTGIPYPTQTIDFKINPVCVNTEFLEVMNELEPFGAGNTQPVFGLYNMVISDIQSMGNGKHLKITLARNSASLSVLKFRMTQAEFPFVKGDLVDAAVTFESNEYLGETRLSIFLKNIKLHDMDEDVLFGEMKKFNMLMGAKKVENVQSLMPDRELTAKIYKFIRSSGRWTYDKEMLCSRIGLGAEYYGKVSVAIEALIELGTLIYDENGGITLPQNTAKVNLDDAPVLIRIKNGD